MLKSFLVSMLFVTVFGAASAHAAGGTHLVCSKSEGRDRLTIAITVIPNNKLRMNVIHNGRTWFQKDIRKVDTPRPTQRYYFAGPFTNRNGAPAELMLQVYLEAGSWKAEFSEGSFLPELPRETERLNWGMSCR